MYDLFPWLSDHTIRVLAMLGSWFAAFGTLMVVGVSLWLARRSEKLQLRVTVHIKGYSEMIQGQSVQSRCWVFHIVNTGFRPVTVQRVGWVWREKLGRKSLYDPFPKKLPLTLGPGDHTEVESHWFYHEVVQLLQSRKLVWALVETAIGSKKTPVGPTVRKYLRGEGSTGRERDPETIPSASRDDEPPPSDPLSDVEAGPPRDPTA